MPAFKGFMMRRQSKIREALKAFESHKKGLLLHIAEIACSGLALAWFFLPLFSNARGGMVAPLLPLSFLDSARREIVPFLIVTCVVYPVPLICLFKIASAFLETAVPSIADPARIPAIVLDILGSALVLATLMIQLVSFADGPDFFAALPWLTYAVFFAALAANAASIAFLISAVNKNDPAYQEYLAFKRRGDARGRGLLGLLRGRGIMKRLALTLFPFLLLIIGVPTAVFMRDFSSTLLAEAIADGKTNAERTANVVRANPSEPGIIDDYLKFEARRNADSPVSFRAISFMRRDGKTDTFEIAASTDRWRIGRRVQRRPSTLAYPSYRVPDDSDSIEFIAPVAVSGSLIGFVSVMYAREVISAPYFRAEVKAILIAGLAVYAAIFLTYLFGKNIAFPILLLRMSVHAISQTLAGMMNGRLRVSASLLQYKDRVKTNDEIKALSNEVRAMTSVIRGVVPYLSASALTHAERLSPRTERKNLTFLFTDIRGFTSLCEGHDPDWIVEVLNRYLDIQAGIILANGGDIDKFVGDEIMAMFKGQGKEIAACRAALEINSAIVAEKELADLTSRHAVSIGVGIHSGPVVFGSIGARDRRDFTSIGDTVNLAARLEGATKNYQTRSLISEMVYEKARKSFLCREIDLLTVKGKRESARIFELLRERAKATDRDHETKRIFEEGLELYRKRRWETAEQRFAFLKEKYRDGASEVFLRRVELFKSNPPPQDWDGVFNLMVK